MTNYELYDFCVFCGWQGTFNTARNRSVRESFPCGNCRANLRYRNQAAAVINEYGRGRYVTIRDIIKDKKFNKIRVMENAIHGPFIRYFKQLDNYVQTYLFDDTVTGKKKGDIVSEDLTKLTQRDESFDLILNSDVMEHVAEPFKAFKEIYRVLKFKGTFIFTIPLNWPVKEETVVRAVLKDNDDIKHIEEPMFHNGGDGLPSLVFTDFGVDLLDGLEQVGFLARIERGSLGRFPTYMDGVVVAKKV